ncbi:MAG: dihydrofolate reductase [Proteobacteria bacterium]|nr:dihydrofolate reductase [Pseudomonadota bacterium]
MTNSNVSYIISHIVCITKAGVIGKGGVMPWYVKEDLAYFKKTTLGSPVIMGSKTWHSLSSPLPGRCNIVLSRSSLSVPSEVSVCSSIHEAIEHAKSLADNGRIFIIGGGEVYRATLPYIQRIYLNQLSIDIEGDTYYPSVSMQDFTLEQESIITASFAPTKNHYISGSVQTISLSTRIFKRIH